MGNELKQPAFGSEIATELGLKYVGPHVQVTHVQPLDAVTECGFCFSKNVPEKKLPPGALVIAPPGTIQDQAGVIESGNPRLDFAKALVILERNIGFHKTDALAKVHPTAQVSPHAAIGRGVSIGARSVVGHFAVIADEVVIGDDCWIKSGAVIGEAGFGFERDVDGTFVRLVHLGSVKIGNRVEVGSLTTVCRGTLADTVIEDDVKIDDHVHIAHNCQIRHGAMVVACAEVSGGVELGQNSWVGPNASIIQKMKIGANAVIGIGANVIRPVDVGSTVAGNPAKPLTPRS